MPFKCNVLKRLADIEANQITIINLLQQTANLGDLMKVDLTEVLAAVAEQKTVNASIEKLVDGLAGQLATLGAQPTVDPADIRALAAAISANNAEIQKKVTDNTPGVVNPPPPPPPSV